MAWRVLLTALNRIENSDGQAHVIDPKAISKMICMVLWIKILVSIRFLRRLNFLFQIEIGEWSDGLFTHILRKIIDNLRGELTKRQWIIFDGDVDPEWVENLNSVLDDNKLLTLPNGERLALPPNVRVVSILPSSLHSFLRFFFLQMFEVQDLRHATLATVSRTGMVWFNQETVTSAMLLQYYLNRIRKESVFDVINQDDPTSKDNVIQSSEENQTRILEIYNII